MADQITGFVCYSHADERLYEELLKHLKTLEGMASFWSDQKILPGDKWDEAILGELRTAHVILLLISIDFINSKYIETVEVKEAMERDKRGEACVIPIILRTTNWTDMPYHELQALPKGGKPVTKWSDHDEAFTNIVLGIKEAVKKLDGKPTEPPIISEKQIREDMLHTALLSLDYREQAKAFRRVIENEAHVGAFLIHGETEYGQAWLLNRLVNNTAMKNVGKEPFKFPLTPQASGIALGKLWYSLGQWLDSSTTTHAPEPIVKQVYTLWQEQSLIFKFYDIERATEEYVQDFLHSFWEPLINMISKSSQKPPNHYLLLFLIDSEGRVDDWHTGWHDQLDTPAIPVKLKKIQKFTNKDIEDWIDSEVNRLPSILTTQEILAESDIPERVLEHICTLCGYEWYSQKGAWL